MADVNNPDDTILGLDEPKEKEGSYEDFSSLQGLVKERFFKSVNPHTIRSRTFSGYEWRWFR